MTDLAAANTDRELYRESDMANGSYYSDSLHVTERGGIGINVGGLVLVRPLRVWHARAVGVERAIRDYHYALDMREHGEVTANRAIKAIEAALEMPWVQGEEKQIRTRVHGERQNNADSD